MTDVIAMSIKPDQCHISYNAKIISSNEESRKIKDERMRRIGGGFFQEKKIGFNSAIK